MKKTSGRVYGTEGSLGIGTSGFGEKETNSGLTIYLGLKLVVELNE